MAFSYIEPDGLLDAYNDAKKFMKPLFEPFDEFERIARNRPHPGIAKHLPKVTDGTLAALIQEQPKRIIQQIPTGQVKTVDEEIGIIAGYILAHEILPNSEQQTALIQKCWAALTKALTYGSQPAFVQFLNRGDYFGTDFSLPYIKDVLLEPGKLSDRDSNIIMLRSWYLPNQINAIIAREQMLAKKAKGRGETYETGWDLAKLAQLKDMKAAKPSDAQNAQERKSSQDTGFIEIVHTFQRGIGANFYSSAPQLGDDNLVRTRKNKDPRGQIPIHYLYSNVDLSNPLGRGAVEISGGMQNLLDFEVQSYQWARALGLEPPVKKRGSLAKSAVKWLPSAQWDMGTDPTNDVEVVDLSTHAIEQFPNNYGLIKSQILNLNSGGNDNAISSTAGDPQTSKTQAGVKSNQLRLGVSDNYARRQFEDWFSELCETQVNLYFAERSGTQELTVDPATADRLRTVNPALVNQDSQIRINYDSETPKLKFHVDASSSQQDEDQEQIEALQELLQQTSQDPMIGWRLGQDGYKLDLGEAYKQLFERYKIKDIHKIIAPMGEQDKQQAAQSPMPLMDKPKITVAYDDLADNPAAQQAALANAGINLPVEVFQQAQATRLQAEAAKNAPAPTGPEEHPLVKAMATLGIKGTDLDPDTLRVVLSTLFGVTSTAPLPSEVDQASKVQDMQLKAGDQAHQQQMDTADLALRLAQHQHSVEQSQADTTLKVAQHQQSAKQATDSHELAVQTAKRKPPAAAGAK